MKNIILLLLIPIFSFGQVINTFPWANNFEGNIPLEQDQNDDGDWLLNQGPTSSFNTGPTGDHTTGSGTYFYVEASHPNYPNKQFISYTPTFDVSATPGKVLSFWYHMFGPEMGELEIAAIDVMGNYIFIGAYNGDQGMPWHFAYYPLDSLNLQHDFKIAFVGNTGSLYTSDICIDDVKISDAFTIVFGCTDSVAPNYNPLATVSNGSCVYILGCMDSLAENYNPWANIDNSTCVMEVACSVNQSLIKVVILLDNWPNETSWEIKANGVVVQTVSSGTYDYTQIGQTVYTEVCVPIGDTIVFTINDTYGDGIGGGSVVGSCLVTNTDCLDTIFNLNPPNFGFSASSASYVAGICGGNTPILGCMDNDYVEYNELANTDDGSCNNLATYGCTDPLAFNYDPTADKMELTTPCDYNLILYDAGGDSWGNCWLGVKQGNSLWQFKIDSNGIYSDTFNLSLSSYEEVYVYYFEVPTPQQNPQQLDIQTIQNSFKLENSYGTILYEGNNPWPGPNENKLRDFKNPEDIHTALPYCGNECIDVIVGCLDATAYNYSDTANTADTCYYNPGCTSPAYLEYYTQGYTADIDDTSCVNLAVFGCTDVNAFNYDASANVDNGGCVAVVVGCMNPLAFNYNASANTAGNCIPVVTGCTSSIALNYDPTANTDDGSCIGVIYGCMDPDAFNYDPLANVEDNSCIDIIYGCMDATMYNYDPLANIDNGNCIPFVYGCTDSTMFNYNPLANADNNSCIPFVYGCTDPSMLNYNSEANTEDFSCIAYVYGCMDSLALNFDTLANTDNGSCIEIVVGCMDPGAYNYESTANVNDTLFCLYDAGCITGSGYPYWLNDPCYAWVIEVDEYCCQNEWDTICQLTYDYCNGTWSGPLLTRTDKNKNLIMITDLLGRPTKENKNQLLFYIYNNGTVERRVIKQ
tara:strand:+ start:397 stop:3162 length:2766 start_codon:yes stop_codon:yes gene_type:complete